MYKPIPNETTKPNYSHVWGESYFLPHWMMLQCAVTRKSSTYHPVMLWPQKQNSFKVRIRDITSHIFIHIHLTLISREIVPYFSLHFNFNLFTLSFSDEFETVKWCVPLLQKIIMPCKWRKLLTLMAACWRLQFCE